jgi:hypothetical protein
MVVALHSHSVNPVHLFGQEGELVFSSFWLRFFFRQFFFPVVNLPESEKRGRTRGIVTKAGCVLMTLLSFAKSS